MAVRCRMVALFGAVLLLAGAGRAGEFRLEKRVYSVTDLILSAEKSVQHVRTPGSRAAGWTLATKNESRPRVRKGAAAATVEEKLIKLITDTIAPRSWADHGGRGTIDYYPLTMSLVVTQTPEVQDQITDLLAAVRRVQEQEVAVEVKFAVVSDEALQELKQQGILGEMGKDKHGREKIALLDNAAMNRFMETIQSDVHTNVLQAPKMTVFNGQNAAFDCGDPQSFVTGLEIVHQDNHIEYREKTETVLLGTRLAVRPVISADRRSVRIRLDARLCNLASGETPRFHITTPAPGNEVGPDGKPKTVTHYIQQPQFVKMAIKRTLAIPEGQTAVLPGFTQKQVQATRTAVPILGDVPIVGCLFSSCAYQEVNVHLLVLVTPRIIIQREEEVKQTGYAPPPAVLP